MGCAAEVDGLVLQMSFAPSPRWTVVFINTGVTRKYSFSPQAHMFKALFGSLVWSATRIFTYLSKRIELYFYCLKTFYDEHHCSQWWGSFLQALYIPVDLFVMWRCSGVQCVAISEKLILKTRNRAPFPTGLYLLIGLTLFLEMC